ncbi:MAG: polysaccharide biosynthesis protein [Lachnospiraceae bacterium]|nr:polysaccharide biosynthesis protein [Lachnospiraceae bacterium]MEE0958437.1 polysaccharide biosynthesis protein [Lachnospiraceae bacterium]
MNTRKKRKSNFLIQGSILAVSSIISRIIGFVYRIPITNALGEEGMGYYSQAYSIYSILLMLSCLSLPSAVSKLVAERYTTGQKRNAFTVFKASMLFAIIVGSTATLITYFGASFFANQVLNTPGCVFAIRMIAPTILVVAVTGVIKGYFQGIGTNVPTAISQLIDQIFNAIVSIVGCTQLMKAGRVADLVLFNGETNTYALGKGASGAILGTAVGAFTGLVFLAIVFLMYRRSFESQVKRDTTRERESYSSIYPILIATIIPIILSTTIYNISEILDASIFGHVLKRQGIDNKTRAALWGSITSKYRLFTNLPVSIASALAVSILPSLTKAAKTGDKGDAVRKIQMSMRFTMLIAIPSMVGLAVLAGPIYDTIYSSQDNTTATIYTQIGAITVVLFSISTVTNAMLQGLGRLKAPVKHGLIGLISHVIVVYLLLALFRLGGYAIVIGDIVLAGVICYLNMKKIRKITRYRQEIRRTFVIPFICSIIMGAAAYAIYFAIYKVTQRNIFAMPVSIIVAVIVYGISIIKLKGLSQDDILSMPMGKKLLGIFKKLHLM